MNIWGETVQSADVVAGIAVDELSNLITWFKTDIEKTGKLPPDAVQKVGASLSILSQSLEQLTASISRVAAAQRFAVLSFLGGERLDREQFYILLMSEIIEWSNKNLGLSDFDDFELFDLLRFEDGDRKGYIYLGDDINDPIEEDPDDIFGNVMANTYRARIFAPEELRWGALSQEQQEFFVKHLPDAVLRFKRDS